MSGIGILAFGSLIDDPGVELGPKIVHHVPTMTPFPVEYARISATRGGAPTAVPHSAGCPVNAVVLVLSDDVSIEHAKDMLWRREVRAEGSARSYAESGSPNAVVVREILGYCGLEHALYTDFNPGGKLAAPDPRELAKAAIDSLASAPPGKDGVSYLVALINAGVETPLTRRYAEHILSMTIAPRLAAAVASLDAKTSGSLAQLVVAADWSKDPAKRWMVRAERDESGAYVVSSPEPVGDVGTLIHRLRKQVGDTDSVLIGFDFPIGLPAAYAQSAGLVSFRNALRLFGSDPWADFYTVSNTPRLHQPFFPLPTQVRGNYRETLARALGWQDLAPMLRRCDRKTATRRQAECVFFTLGGAQVGAGAIVGWRDVIQPSLDTAKLWPFDGDVSTLLGKPGVTIAEIYPAEAYSHLGVKFGGRGRGKTSREARKEATRHWLADFASGRIRLSNAARSWVDWGFLAEDDFDAMAGLLSMLQVLTGQRSARAPDTPEVRQVEGWILGQEVTDIRREYLEAFFEAAVRHDELPRRFGIVTACNPLGVQQDLRLNEEADRQLDERLNALELQHFRVTGGSHDGAHQEPGFGIVTDARERVRLVSREFQQEAFFWVEDGVVYCESIDGATSDRIGTWRERQIKVSI